MTYVLVIFYTIGGVTSVPEPSLQACLFAREALYAGYAELPKDRAYGHPVAVCIPTGGNP